MFIKIVLHTILKSRRANAIRIECTKKAPCEKCLCFRNSFDALKSITRDCNERGPFRNHDRSVNFKVDFNYTRHIFPDVYLIRSFNRFSLSNLQKLFKGLNGRTAVPARSWESLNPRILEFSMFEWECLERNQNYFRDSSFYQILRMHKEKWACTLSLVHLSNTVRCRWCTRLSRYRVDS